MLASCSRTRRMSVPAGRLSRCRPRLDTLSTALVSRRDPRFSSATTSKYVSLRTAASTGPPTARSSGAPASARGALADGRDDSTNLT